MVCSFAQPFAVGRWTVGLTVGNQTFTLRVTLRVTLALTLTDTDTDSSKFHSQTVTAHHNMTPVPRT